MDPAEVIFASVLRLWKRVRPDNGARPGHAAALDQHSDRLELLGAMLIGERPAVRPADDAGGLLGTTLLLPRCVALLPDRDRNVELLVARVALAAVARELQLDTVPEHNRTSAAITDALAGTIAIRELRVRYAPAARVLEQAAAAELEARCHALQHAPRRAERAAQRHPIAALQRHQLARVAGVALPPLARQALEALPPDARAWVDQATNTRCASLDRHANTSQTGTSQTAPGDPDLAPLARALREARDELLDALPRADRRAPPPPATVTLGGHLWHRPHEEVRTGEDDGRDERANHDAGVIQLDRTIHLRRRELGRREDRPLYHMFEKLETAEDFGGEEASPDPTGDASEMHDAVSDLTLGTAVRTDEAPEHLIRAEVIVDPGGVEVVSRAEAEHVETIHYPEWNLDRGAYRDDWVTLREERLVIPDGGATNLRASDAIIRRRQREVHDVRGQLLRALREHRVRDRQTDGPDFDISAMVDRHADLAAGQTPTDRLYLSPRRATRDAAILIVLDTSYSTDAWLDGRRVLDVETESLLVLAAALDGILEQEIAVVSFNSRTRNDVRVGVIKRFNDPWTHLKRVVPGLVPAGYTRIGAAVRHATAMLEPVKARDRLLLFVSDGKPIDYDRYEGPYGVADVAMAIREARQHNIKVFGLAVEKEAKRHLSRMMGAGNYRVLPRTDDLPAVMADVFVRWMAS